MSRFALAVGMLVLGTMLILRGGSAPVPDKVAPPKDPSPVAVLQLVVPEFDELPANPKTQLDHVLNILTAKCKKELKVDLSFEINQAAFAAEGVIHPQQSAIVQEVGLPRMTNITIERYLRRICERVPIPSGAMIVPRRDHIEISTGQRLQTQIWGKDFKGPFLPLVQVRYEKKPLDEALKDLADQSEHNIVLDPKVGEKGKTPITVRLLNPPLDTALVLLTDMAELQPVLQDNVIYVTTRENALRWESRMKKDKQPDDDSGPRIGAGLRGFLPLDRSGM